MRDLFSIVLVPIALVLGISLGMQLAGNRLPIEVVQYTLVSIVGTWVAFLVIWLLIEVVAEPIIELIQGLKPEDEPTEGKPGELTVLLIRDGEAVGELRSWDKPMPKGKREFWIRKLGRILMRRAKQAHAEQQGA